MTDHDVSSARIPEYILVTVLRARNMRGQKGETVSVIVKAEYGDKHLGESVKVDCLPDETMELNFQSQLKAAFDDPHTLDELSNNAVLLTISEILPKEKKQKDEKTIILGQISVDLLPLVQGEMRVSCTMTVNPVPGSPLENLLPDIAKPELDVQISVLEPLLSESQQQEANVMDITLESVYSPPDSWALSSQYVYTAGMPVPLTAERENLIVFAGGVLKAGPDREIPVKNKKWANPGNALGNSVFIPNKLVSDVMPEDENGDLRGKGEEREHRILSENEKNRVTWNVERRCYMDPAAAKSFQDRVAKTRYWPVEVFRTAIQGQTKGKKEEESVVTFHGVAYVNMAPLLYPGVKKIKGAYKVHAYTDHDVLDKTNRRQPIAEEAYRIATGIMNRSGSSPFPKTLAAKGGKEALKDAASKKRPSQAGSTFEISTQGMEHSSHSSMSMLQDGKASKAADVEEKKKGKPGEGGAPDPDGIVNLEGQQYVDARSYVVIEINLNRPLVRKRTPEELASRVATYVPPRPQFPKRSDGAERAVNDFHSQVAAVGQLVLDEFRNVYNEEQNSGGDKSSTLDEMRHSLYYKLNSSGKYFAFKEQLKHSVVKIVREKYLKTVNFKDNNELQTFLSELYVYLVDQMHVGLSKFLNVVDQAPVPPPLTDSTQLKHFAREAEVNGNFELAAQYYRERIARDKNDPDHWLDYGTFNLYINDLTKAEECFKECVSIDQRHLPGLLLYGVTCTIQDKNDVAETFFEAATSVEPGSVLAWTMLGLFYDGVANAIGADMALGEANRLNMAEQTDAKRSSENKDKAKDVAAASTAVAGVEASTAAAQLHDADSSVIKEATDLATGSPAISTSSVNKASGQVSRKMSSARKSATGGKLRSQDTVSRPGSQLKSPLSQQNPQEPESSDTPHPAREPTPQPKETVYMFVMDFLLETKATPFAERALSHHLLSQLGGPSADYHICLARLKLEKQQLDEAEESLKEALQFDHQNADAWALMGHVKYIQSDFETAKDCYERTLAFVSDPAETHSIYLRLASIYLQNRNYQDARRTFLLACKRSPSCVSWLGVGIACFRLNELEEAEDALCEANILNNTDPEVWAYLSLVCIHTARQVEAEQAYKYAIKLNLQDNNLLEELRLTQEKYGFGNPQL